MTGEAGWPHVAGEMADRVRGFEWAATPLGRTQNWSAELRAAVQICLGSPLIASLVVGQARTFIYNDLAIPHYGPHHPQALGQPLPALFPQEFEKVAHLYAKVFGGESIHVPAQKLLLDRESVPELFEAYLTPVYGADGGVIAAFMTGFANSDKMRVETALRESEQRMKLAVAASGSYGWEIDFDTRAIVPFGNPVEVLGFDMPVAESDRFAMVHPDDAGRVRAVFDEALAERSAYRIDHRLIHPDTGETIWLRVDAEPFEKRKLIGVVRNITPERRAEAALRGSEEHKAFLLSVSDAMRTLQQDRAIMACAAELLGKHLGVERVGYCEIDGEAQYLDVQVEWRSKNLPSAIGRQPIADYGTELIALNRAGLSWVIHDVEKDDRPVVQNARERYLSWSVRAAISIPLIKRGTWVASLYVNSADARRWSDAEVDLARDVAERTWDAVEQARVETALRISEERLRAFGEASQDVLWIRDIEKLQWQYLTPAFDMI